MAIKKNDFIQVSYTGKTKDEGFIFDTTQESLAKKQGIHNPESRYGPVTICIGKRHILPSLEKNLEGKELGSYTFTLSAPEAFGKKNAKLINLIPTQKFIKDKIMPQAGLQVNIDGHLGIVKTVTGGRTLVDFNHPLSGKDVVYEITVHKTITDQKEQVLALLQMKIPKFPWEVQVENKIATITTPKEFPKPIQDQFAKEIQESVSLEKIEWKVKT